MSTWTKAAPNIYRYTPNSVYYIRMRLPDGKRIQQSLETTDLATAKRKAADKKAAALNGKVVSKTEGMIDFATVSRQWFNAHKHTLKPSTIRVKELHLKSINSVLPNKSINKYRPIDIENWMQERSSASASVVNHELECINGIFKYAIQHNHISENPARNVDRKPQTKKLVRAMTREEMATLINTMRTESLRFAHEVSQGADIFAVCAASGMRVSEAAALRWSDVDFTNGRVAVRGTKTAAASRVIPMFPKLRTELEQIQARRNGSDQIFSLIRPDNVNEAIAKACKRIYNDRSKWTSHDARKYFITCALESGIDVQTISQWVGHSDGGALLLRTYAHVRPQYSDAQAQKLVA